MDTRYRQLLRGDDTRYENITLIDALADVVGYKHILVDEMIAFFILLIHIFINGEYIFVGTQDYLIRVIFRDL